MAGRPWLPAGDPFAAGLGGTEQAVIALTGALAARGHRVSVAGASQTARGLGGVAWLAPGQVPATDITVAINDARLLPPAAGVAAVWFHNEVEFWREARKRRLSALWRHRPQAVFIGTDQARQATRLLPFASRTIIPYGLPDRVLHAPAAPSPPGPHALFTSQAYRGLRAVIGMWRRHVLPAAPGARLSAYIDAADVPGYQALAAGAPSIRIRSRIGNAAVLDVLRDSRVLLAPGHRAETFCMAAAEAVAMGVPVVSHGIGSLKERVADGITGYLCNGDWAAMAARTVALLTDDGLWRRMHDHGLATRAGHGWAEAAQRWERWAEGVPRPGSRR